METFLWTFICAEDLAPKFRLPFRLMRGPLGFFLVQVLNMMMKNVIPEHCAITDEGMESGSNGSRRCITGCHLK